MAYSKSNKTSKEKIDVYEIVTNRILEKLEQGQIPWHKPWNIKTGLPCNIVTGKEYNGMNLMLLGCQNYDSKYWLTFNQCADNGGHVKKGEKGSMIVFWNFLDKTTNKAVDKDSDAPKPKSGDVVPILKYYTVFNVNQCEGLDLKRLTAEMEAQKLHADKVQEPPGQALQSIVDQYVDGPEIKFGFTKACYRPSTDEINMPRPEAFNSIEEHYGTLFHEMIHSTGHESRLGREIKNQFGDEKYSKEELVAEMGASFLCAKAGIENHTIDNSAAYIQSWMKALQDDKKMLITAAGQVQKAANHITGTVKDLDVENTKTAAIATHAPTETYYYLVRDSMDVKNSIHCVYAAKTEAERYIQIMNTNVNGTTTGQYNIGSALTTHELKENLSIFNEHQIMREWSKKTGSTTFPDLNVMTSPAPAPAQPSRGR